MPYIAAPLYISGHRARERNREKERHDKGQIFVRKGESERGEEGSERKMLLSEREKEGIARSRESEKQ